MHTGAQAAAVSKKSVWIGWVLSAIPALLLLFSAFMAITKPPEVVQGMAQMGYPEHIAQPMGILAAICAVLFLIPRTAVLGAIMVTAYFGGATATHVRIGDPFFIPVVLGAIAWLGLYLREPRLRELLPLRK